MDDPLLRGDALKQNLDELERINTWLGGYAIVLDTLEHLRYAGFFNTEKPVRIVDLGSGGGDTLRAVASWARKKKVRLELVGVDFNDFMLDYAQQKCHQYPEITFLKLDIFDPEFANMNFDLALCSLFCHHFSNAELVQIFSTLRKNCAIGFVINDLHRHPLAFYGIKFLTWLFRGSFLVRHDAPLSVLRAFHYGELKALMQQTGIERYYLAWRWAFRFRLIAFTNNGHS
ncbi:MAG: methyltransferase domain-containing protein [Cytophagales bacterium]|nr:MAG: methyltransferase domain-containing protein [Cytophagales bacterium]TAF62383.1 MAG: methyltransferase domain-containing protein [Cytophagales bacterium]